MGSRARKKEVFAILTHPDLPSILDALLQLPPGEIINPLFSAICQNDETIRWHAISAMGPVVAGIADRDMEDGRIVVRRLLWSLNDESGGIGWGAPESLGEIMASHDELAREYLHMLISYMREDGKERWQEGNFLEHEVLQRGLLWGVGRAAHKNRTVMLAKSVDQDLLHYLHSADGSVRGLAVRALGLIAEKIPDWNLQVLLEDKASVRLYEDGEFSSITVAELTSQALSRINAHRST